MSGIVVKRGVVLVVEDEDDLREIVADALVEEHYEVHRAANGQEAIDQLDAGLRPDVILLDLTMPTMDGRSMLEELAADPAHAGSRPTIIVMTAQPTKANNLPGAIFAVLYKPVYLHVLLEAVAQGCREAQHARGAQELITAMHASPAAPAHAGAASVPDEGAAGEQPTDPEDR